MFLHCIALCLSVGRAGSLFGDNVIIVNSLIDAEANATDCSIPLNPNTPCTLRSAFSYCDLIFSSSDERIIALPAASVVEMNATIGPIDVPFSSSVRILLDGDGSTVTLDSASRSSLAPASGLLTLVGDGNMDIHVTIRDVTFTHFTETVVHVQHVNIALEETQFISNNAPQGKRHWFT